MSARWIALLAIFAGGFQISAWANPLDSINRQTSICFGQEYSRQHMKSHPTQTVSSLLIDLAQQPDEADPTIYLNMKIKISGQHYDSFLVCERQNEKLNCAVECDGGKAEVVTYSMKSDEMLFMNKGFLVSGGCGAQEEPLVWLEPTPNGDDVFELEPRSCN